MRTYEIGTRKLPSVTTILSILRSPPLERWRGDVGNLVADSRMSDGGARGTNVHSLCEYLCKHGTAPPSIPTHLRSRYAAFADFYDKYIGRVIDAESVVSYTDPQTGYGYAGRCDLVVQLKMGLVAAIDIKTSKMITEKMGMQLAAYTRAYEHNYAQARENTTNEFIQVHYNIVLQLHAGEPHTVTQFPPDYAHHDPEPTHDTYTFIDRTADLAGFDSALGLFMWATRSGLIDREFARPALR